MNLPQSGIIHKIKIKLELGCLIRMCFIKGNLCPNNLIRVPSAHIVSWLKKPDRCPSSDRYRPMPETCILCWKSWISCQCWELNTGHWNLKHCHVHIHTACMHALSLQSCPTLCNPMDCSPLAFSVHGIFQARILEYVDIPSSHIHTAIYEVDN